MNSGVRFLYTAEALSLHRYASVREKVLRQYGGPEMVDKFRARMQEMAQSGSSVHIFNDDLRDMLYLAEDAEEDVELLRTMLAGYGVLLLMLFIKDSYRMLYKIESGSGV